jgi:transposase
MARRSPRRYPKELKAEALELLRTTDKSMAEIERELGITPGLLIKWKISHGVLLDEQENKALYPKGMDEKDEKNQRLERRLRIANEEIEILKKALGIFSRKSE